MLDLRGAKGRFVSGAINGCLTTSMMEVHAPLPIEDGGAAGCEEDEMEVRHRVDALEDACNQLLVSPLPANEKARLVQERPTVSGTRDFINGGDPFPSSIEGAAGPMRLEEEPSAINGADKKNYSSHGRGRLGTADFASPVDWHARPGEISEVGSACGDEIVTMNSSSPCVDMCQGDMEMAGNVNGFCQQATTTCNPGDHHARPGWIWICYFTVRN